MREEGYSTRDILSTMLTESIENNSDKLFTGSFLESFALELVWKQ